MNVKFFSFSKLNSDKPIYFTTNEKHMDSTYQQESQKVTTEVKNLELKQEEHQKINTSNGSWYCRIDKNDIIYLVLTNT